MTVDEFLASASATDIRLSVTDSGTIPGRAPETIDALFHLPLLALAVMVIARRSPFRTVVLGRNVTMLLVEHFSALKHSPHGLESSLTLRRRCADALAFLEAAGLAIVSQDRLRTITLSQAGKSHIDHAVRDATDLGLFVRQLRNNQDRVLARIGDEH
jgi:hypothetical protein